MKFDHIGIFVSSLETGRIHMEKIFDIKQWSNPVKDPIQGVFVQFGYDSLNICYELVAPAAKTNPVDKVLKNSKNILNHVAYKVKDINSEISRLRDNKCILISGPSPALAFDNNNIAFLYTPLKFIIELIEL